MDPGDDTNWRLDFEHARKRTRLLQFLSVAHLGPVVARWALRDKWGAQVAHTCASQRWGSIRAGPSVCSACTPVLNISRPQWAVAHFSENTASTSGFKSKEQANTLAQLL